VQEENRVKVYAGIDWAERHHDVAMVDQDGQLVAKRRFSDDAAGFAELLALLTEAGDSGEDPIPVAIETPRGLLVAALRATGRAVYAINPMAVARYRERHSVSRKKSDHFDAMTLANILRTDAHAHRKLPADSELARAVAVLARAAQDAIWRRTKATQELRSLLREFYPGFLQAFARGTVTNLAGPDARALKAYAGSAPVTRASGRSISITRRMVKNNRLNALGFLWAFAAMPRPGPAKEHYNRRRAAGDRHAAALRNLRNLFNRMLGQLYHCLQTGQTYDERKAYTESSAAPASAAA
jgi:hypothetical protein